MNKYKWNLFRAGLIVLLLTLGSVKAAELVGSIAGPKTARVGQLVQLEKTTTDSGKWVTLDTANFAVVEAGRIAFFSAERAGVYSFAIVDPAGQTDKPYQLPVLARHSIVVGGGPDPDPDPDPDPNPDPQPTPGPITLVVIEQDQGDRPAKLGNLLDSLRKSADSGWMKENKHNLWILDKDDPLAATQMKPDRVLPEAVLYQKGKEIKRVPLPQTLDGVLKLLGKGG